MNKMEEPTIYKLLSLKCVNIIQHPSFTYFHKVHKVCFLTFRFVSQDGFVASWAPQSGLRSRCVAPDDGEQPAAALGHRPQQASPKTLKLKVFKKNKRHARALEHMYVWCHIIICPKKGVQVDTVFAFVKVKQSRNLATPFSLWLRHSCPHVCAHCAPLSVSDFRSRCNWWLGKSKDCTLWYEPVRIGWQLCQSYPTIAGKRAVHILLLEDAVRIRQPGNLVIG